MKKQQSRGTIPLLLREETSCRRNFITALQILSLVAIVLPLPENLDSIRTSFHFQKSWMCDLIIPFFQGVKWTCHYLTGVGRVAETDVRDQGSNWLMV